jgi:hypothetical protein
MQAHYTVIVLLMKTAFLSLFFTSASIFTTFWRKTYDENHGKVERIWE